MFQIAEMLPGILTQLGSEGLNHLKRLANNVVVGNKLLGSVNEEEDDVPNLVENFEDASKQEVDAGDAQKSPVATADGEKAAADGVPSSPEKSTETKIEEVAAEVAAASLEDIKKNDEETTPKKSDDKSKKNEKGSGSSGKKDKQNKDKKA